MYRDQGRRTGGIDREAGSAESEKVCQSPSRNAAGGSRCGVGIDTFHIITAGTDTCIITCADPHKYPRTFLFELMGCLSGILESFPGDFQQQSLLGIDTHRFTRSNTEKLWIKLIHLPQKTATAGIHFPTGSRIRVVVAINIPAVFRNFSDRVKPIFQ